MFCTETVPGNNLELVAKVFVYDIDILSGLIPDKLKLLEVLL